MAKAYRVVATTTGVLDAADIIIEGAKSPEEAARKALGIDVIRGGQSRDLVARVYWELPGQPMNMARLYRKAE